MNFELVARVDIDASVTVLQMLTVRRRNYTNQTNKLVYFVIKYVFVRRVSGPRTYLHVNYHM